MHPHCLTVWPAPPGWAVSSPPVIPTPPETRAMMMVNSNIKTHAGMAAKSKIWSTLWPGMPGFPTGPCTPGAPISPGGPGMPIIPVWPFLPGTPGFPGIPGSPECPLSPFVPGSPWSQYSNYLGISNTNLQHRDAVFTNIHISTHLAIPTCNCSRVSYDQKCIIFQHMLSWWRLFRSSPCRPWYHDLQLYQEFPVKPCSTGDKNTANSMYCKSSPVLLCLPVCPQDQLDLVVPASQIQMNAHIHDLQ